MNTGAYRELDRRCLWHPYSRHSAIRETDFPVITRGEGIYLFDLDGRRYIDAISSWWACNLGHGHPRLVAAITRQAAELQHSILGNLSHPRAIELAGGLVDLLGGIPRRVFFAGDGASVVEAALKIAVQYWHNLGRPARRRFVSLQNAYHGDTLGAVSVGYLPGFHAPFKPLLFDVLRAESPCCGLCAWGKTVPTCRQECFEPMRALLEKHAAEIAAVIVEPLCQCAAGMRIYAPQYLALLAAACRRHDIILIVDEIATGFGRTGRMFAYQHAGIDPDIVCLGKGLSGGYLPISATVVQERIYAAFEDRPRDGTFYHGHTFAGNPIACAAALETLNVYEQEGIVAQAERKGQLLAAEMAALGGQRGVKNVRCLGMIAAAELDGAARAQSARLRLLERGVLARPLDNVLYLMPPLITPDDVLRNLVRELGDALDRA